MPDQKIDVAALRRLLMNAYSPPGRWTYASWRDEERPASIHCDGSGGGHAVAMSPRYAKANDFKADAELIAALINAAPALLDVAEAAQAFVHVSKSNEGGLSRTQVWGRAYAELAVALARLQGSEVQS
jgi:hypothetical protein